MQKLFKSLRSYTFTGLVAGLLTLPVLINGNSKNDVALATKEVKAITTSSNAATLALEAEASNLYNALALDGDISMKTLIYALKGYKYLQANGLLGANKSLAIVDFSQSSRKKRLYIIDVENQKLLYNTYVAHGRNSGEEYAKNFSNSVDSHQSSLGFYVTSNTYSGSHGLSLRIEGMEKGFNDNALERAIVVHGANYMGERYLKNSRFSGRSWGCPAVPNNETAKVINMIKDGSCLFIFHPTEKYLSNSRILNDETTV